MRAKQSIATNAFHALIDTIAQEEFMPGSRRARANGGAGEHQADREVDLSRNLGETCNLAVTNYAG